ncbi:LysR family transcriptional regulator [Paludibacterium purpuratum]|uniref:LysR family transcriptional regulator n=1 Tax=Paludibacterium purpuratum TaxID=1144873 RepID=A0A4R7BFC4_9NEIS|nr:LysR family transcriptional regulator [Paludibacterium purpuratum]TDR82982.1 LysR family transcriptional regulator [Paludibacterium purpuratum]
MPTLDIAAVRAFVAIADLKSFTRAAEVLGTSQAALSIKLKRLEKTLNHRLVERTPRQVRLSLHGERFIESARDFLDAHERAIANLATPREQIRLGVSSHVFGPEMPYILSRLRSLAPSLVIELQLDSACTILGAYGDRQLDAVVIRREDDMREGTTLCPEEYGWYASPDFDCAPDTPLPLASISPLCGVRNLAIHALEKTSLRWTEVFIGGNMQAVMAAVSAGLAVGAFPRRLAKPALIDVADRFGLPSLPSSSIVMLSSLSDRSTREALHTVATAFREYHAMGR